MSFVVLSKLKRRCPSVSDCQSGDPSHRFGQQSRGGLQEQPRCAMILGKSEAKEEMFEKENAGDPPYVVSALKTPGNVL